MFPAFDIQDLKKYLPSMKQEVFKNFSTLESLNWS